MLAHSLGHATWLVETTGGVVLTDPVFSDPFEAGAVVSCPQREIRVDAVPRPDLVFLSHRHLDHFDIPSLKQLDPSVPVYHADDPLLAAGLRRLGFHDLHPLTPWTPVALDGGLRLLPTPSRAPLPEVGLVLEDPSGALFDQVDTVLTPQDVARLGQAVERLDVHLSMFASQNFGVFLGESEDWTQTHAHNLNVALGLGASLVVPASGGFRFADDIDWLNRHLFPVTPGDFRRDLGLLWPEQRCSLVDPGDSLAIGRETKITAGTAPGTTMVQRDLDRLAHDPSAPVPALVDDNVSGHAQDLLEHGAAWLCSEGLGRFMQEEGPSDPVVARHLQRGVVYRIDLVHPGGSQAFTWSFDPAGRIGLTVGEDSPTPNVRHAVAASALLDMLAGTRPLFWTRTRSRRASLLRDVTRTAHGAAVGPARVPDLLHHFVANHKAARLGPEQAELEYHGVVEPAEPDVTRWLAG